MEPSQAQFSKDSLSSWGLTPPGKGVASRRADSPRSGATTWSLLAPLTSYHSPSSCVPPVHNGPRYSLCPDSLVLAPGHHDQTHLKDKRQPGLLDAKATDKLKRQHAATVAPRPHICHDRIKHHIEYQDCHSRFYCRLRDRLPHSLGHSQLGFALRR